LLAKTTLSSLRIGQSSEKWGERGFPLPPPLVNFTNILRAAFAPIFFCQKLQRQTVIRKKRCKTLLYKKARVKCWWN